MSNITTEQPIEKPIAVGDIFEMSWGYDQTNVDYFQVTRLTPKGVYVRAIGAKSVPGTQGFMSERVVPNSGNFLDRCQWCRKGDVGNAETFRRLDSYKGTPCFNFEGRYFAHRINPTESTYSSWYH